MEFKSQFDLDGITYIAVESSGSESCCSLCAFDDNDRLCNIVECIDFFGVPHAVKVLDIKTKKKIKLDFYFIMIYIKYMDLSSIK